MKAKRKRLNGFVTEWIVFVNKRMLTRSLFCWMQRNPGYRILWIHLPMNLMAKYNKEQAIVFNTYQLYRTASLKNLKDAFHEAAMHNYFLGAKLVRGAYLEKERTRAEQMGYPSPIYPDKDSTDSAFNQALTFCIDNKQRISVMCGSHNEYSNYYLMVLMEKHSMKNSDNRVWFAQLYGMSDNISFSLAKAGYRVAKYVPYGPVRSVLPYLLRRAAENTSVAGQSSRELMLIHKEIKRRREDNRWDRDRQSTS